MYFVRCNVFGMAGAFAVALSAPVSGAPINVSATYDLSNFTTQPLDENVTIGAGDSVSYDVTFADNKALRLTALDDTNTLSFWMYGFDLATSSLSNMILTFDGLLTDSHLTNPYDQASPAISISIIGSNIFDEFSAGEYIQFTGFNLAFDVVSQTAWPTQNQLDKTYSSAWLPDPRNSFDVEIVDVAPVPAPPAVLLFLSGLGLMSFFRWRSKRQVQAAA